MELMISSNQKWTMVLARDLKADGQFVYAVKSTGIFCRPSCPSRRPRREQVRFFDSPAQAEQAGFRACRRCVPTGRNAQLEKIEAACRYIEQNLEESLNLGDIAQHAGLSPFHFQRLFKRTLGISPRQYQQSKRSEKFKQALHTQPRITDAIYEAGYSSSSRAYENGARQLGMTPSAFRRQGQGEEISYTVLNTELGKLLLAATSRGLCAARFGSSETVLVRELKQEFQAAEIRRDDSTLEPLASRMQNLLRTGAGAQNFPLDIRGTAFQQLVWEALRQVPRGETRSYSEIATQLGRPRAVRAVANACASNPVAVVVPCHRVVQKNGSLAGYRWGMERKRALLESEKRA
jgi:AraC family transcriptional regulator, regulatory protein of adaptative response / methylated-DNA-[protein]-cysteine methyltransferase